MKTVIKFEADAARVESFGGAVQVKATIDPEEFFKLFEWSVIRNYYEEQIEDEILEERNKAYEEGYDKGKEFYSDYADYVEHKRDIIESRY